MPKAKGRDSLRKRLRVTPSGKVVHRRSGKRHLMAKKRSRRRLRLGRPATIGESEARRVKRLPYMGG